MSLNTMHHSYFYYVLSPAGHTAAHQTGTSTTQPRPPHQTTPTPTPNLPPRSEVKIERVEMNRLININVHRTARTLVEESLTDRRDALMEEACQLFGSRLSLYRSFGIRDRERRIVNKLQRLVENALVQRVEVELERRVGCDVGLRSGRWGGVMRE